VALSFRFPPDPQNGFSVANSTYAGITVFWDRDLLCARDKNPGFDPVPDESIGLR
jgi:hypothetical protein